MRKALRYILSGNKLQPGDYTLNNQNLNSIEILVEFRNKRPNNISFNSVKKLVKLTDKLIIDCNSKTHNELTDLLLLGVNRVVIDETSGDQELELAHAISDKVLTRMVLNISRKNDLEYFSKKIKRLAELMEIIPRPLLLVTKKKGDLEKFWPLIPLKIKKQFEWWIAPSEGEIRKLDSKSTIKVWFVSGDIIG